MIHLSYDGKNLWAHLSQPTPRDRLILRDITGRNPTGTKVPLPPLKMTLRQIQRRDSSVTCDPGVALLDTEWGFFPRDDWSKHIPPTVLDQLTGYQKDALKYLVSSPRHGNLLGLSPGLGKTVVATAGALGLQAESVLVIAPKTLIPTWVRHIWEWAGREGVTRSSSDEPVPGEWNITNYETLIYHSGLYLKQMWDLIIIDESIMVSNRNAQRSKILKSLSMRAKKVWELSGNPITHTVADLWSQFRILEPRLFTSFWRFAQEYTHIETSTWGATIVASRDLDFLDEFGDLMFVRAQKDVLELPPEILETIDVRMTPPQEKIYAQILKEFMVDLSSGSRMTMTNRMAQLVRLLQTVSNTVNVDPGVVSSGKTDTLLELLEFQELKFPLLIWTHWRESAWSLYRRLLKEKYRVGVVTGDSPEREETLSRYLNGEIDILILSLGVGKYGLTLTNTQTVLYYDRSFDGDAFLQSFYRTQRMTLDHSVHVVTLRTPGTVEELVESNLSGKIQEISSITDADLLTLLKTLDGRN